MQSHWVVVKAAHRVKLSKLNQTGSTWTRFFKRRKRFSFSLLSVVFLHTANRPGENELIQFLNYHRRARDVCTQASVYKSVHKITVFIPEIIYGARNGLLMALFIRGGGGTPHNDLYGEAPRERGTFFRLQVYNRVEISPAIFYCALITAFTFVCLHKYASTEDRLLIALSRLELLGMYSAEDRWPILRILLYLAHALNTTECDLCQEKPSRIYNWAVPQAAQK